MRQSWRAARFFILTILFIIIEWHKVLHASIIVRSLCFISMDNR